MGILPPVCPAGESMRSHHATEWAARATSVVVCPGMFATPGTLPWRVLPRLVWVRAHPRTLEAWSGCSLGPGARPAGNASRMPPRSASIKSSSGWPSAG